MKIYKINILLLILFIININVYSQDTIKLNEVTVSNYKYDKIKKIIKNKFKKNFKFSNNKFKINLETTEGNDNIIKIIDNNIYSLDKFIYEKKLPENITSKINNNKYFEGIDDFNSPIYLLTQARFRYLKINEYIKNIEITSINNIEGQDKKVQITSFYKDYNINILLNPDTYNVLSIEFKLKEKTTEKSSRKTTGTSKYINSESSFELIDEQIKFEFEEDKNDLYLKNFVNNILISNYIIKIYDPNKTNKLNINKIFNFKTENYIRKEN